MDINYWIKNNTIYAFNSSNKLLLEINPNSLHRCAWIKLPSGLKLNVNVSEERVCVHEERGCRQATSQEIQEAVNILTLASNHVQQYEKPQPELLTEILVRLQNS